MRIVNYSNFINEAVNHDALAQSIEDCLVELTDVGFEVKVGKVRNNFKGICLFISVKKVNGASFQMKDLKESFDVMIDLLDDGYTYELKTLFRLVFHSTYNTNIEDYNGYYLANNVNTWFDSDIDLFGLEITNIKCKNNIVRSYESVEYSKDKILQEVDELLVELRDSKFDVHSNFIEKDGKNILELWVEKEEPDFDEVEYEDWFDEGGNRFIIGDVYESLALLTDWMSEKYGAELVDDGMNSDTFELKGGEFQMEDSEVFDPEWKEIQRKYYGENYLKKKVAALFVKYVW
jgi:uncharacterized protein (UPF0335 family)